MDDFHSMRTAYLRSIGALSVYWEGDEFHEWMGAMRNIEDSSKEDYPESATIDREGVNSLIGKKSIVVSFWTSPVHSIEEVTDEWPAEDS